MRFLTLTVCISGLLALSTVTLADEAKAEGSAATEKAECGANNNYDCQVDRYDQRQRDDYGDDYRRERCLYKEEEVRVCEFSSNECNLCDGGDGDPDLIDPSLVPVCGTNTCTGCTREVCNECLVPIGGNCNFLNRPGSRSNCVPGSLCEAGFFTNSTLPNGRCLGICTNNNQCPPGSSCINGVCGGSGASCASDLNCAFGLDCVNGVCTPVTCNPSTQCITGFTCVNGGCIQQTCTTTADCPTSFTCAAGICIGSCSAAVPCPSGYVCVSGACEPVCGVNGLSCQAGFTCSAGLCMEGCGVDADCQPGSTCVGGLCTQTTCNPGACTAGSCAPNNLCAPTCTTNENCGPGYACAPSGFCVQSCGNGGTCAAGTVCSPSTGLCQLLCTVGVPGCTQGTTCVGGVCEPTCDPNAQCVSPFTCVVPSGAAAGVCTGPACSSTVPCPAGSGLVCVGGVCSGAPFCSSRL